MIIFALVLFTILLTITFSLICLRKLKLINNGENSNKLETYKMEIIQSDSTKCIIIN
jgi:hypothetical protein